MAKSSQYVGVVKTCGKWMAYTGGGLNKRYHGNYDTENEAARARNDAMIERFGSDPAPNIIAEPGPEVRRFSTTGDPETVIRRLRLIRDAGQGVLYFRSRPSESSMAAKSRTKKLVRFCRTLPYILEVRIGSGIPSVIDLDSDSHDQEWHSDAPWLTASPLQEAATLFHYHGIARPQKMVWQGLHDPSDQYSAFIGTRLQMQVFRTVTELPIMRLIVPKDFTQAARLIQGASLFIGNPSVYSALAQGLGVKTLLES